MVDWGWLVFTFVCGVAITVFSIKKIVIYLVLHDLDRAVPRLKELYEVTEALRIKQSRRQQ